MYVKPRGSWLVARGSWLVARGSCMGEHARVRQGVHTIIAATKEGVIQHSSAGRHLGRRGVEPLVHPGEKDEWSTATVETGSLILYGMRKRVPAGRASVHILCIQVSSIPSH